MKRVGVMDDDSDGGDGGDDHTLHIGGLRRV